MASIGQIVKQTPGAEVLARAQQRAALVPDCMVEARRIANTVIAGWHGRRKRGVGENFWQFRPYAEGESLSRIDWRRSARDDHTYVREREWEAAHTIWLWADMSPSMMYKSTLGTVSKESRALVLMLALAEILARSGERIGCPGIMEPVSARNAAERLATAIMHAPVTNGLPETGMIRGASDIVLIGDFLDDAASVMERISPLARRSLRGHVVEIADPAEEMFPYSGRTEFTDPETERNSYPAGPKRSVRTTPERTSPAAKPCRHRCVVSAGTSSSTALTISPPKRLSPSICICRISGGRRWSSMSFLPFVFPVPTFSSVFWRCQPYGGCCGSPATSEGGNLSAVENPRHRAEAGRNALEKSVVADAAAHGFGRGCYSGAGRSVMNPRNNTLAGTGPLVMVVDNSWAAAPDWDRRVETAKALIGDAERAERPVSISFTADADHDAVPQRRLLRWRNLRQQGRNLWYRIARGQPRP